MRARSASAGTGESKQLSKHAESRTKVPGSRAPARTSSFTTSCALSPRCQPPRRLQVLAPRCKIYRYIYIIKKYPKSGRGSRQPQPGPPRSIHQKSCFQLVKLPLGLPRSSFRVAAPSLRDPKTSSPSCRAPDFCPSLQPHKLKESDLGKQARPGALHDWRAGEGPSPPRKFSLPA